MIDPKKIGIGIITCDRPEMFDECINSMDANAGDFVVVNSGTEKIHVPNFVTEVIDCGKKTPVGHAKNKALRFMRKAGYEYLFLVEDDVKMVENTVFDRYILAAAESGLWAGQLSYGTHGGQKGGNVDQDGNPVIREVVEYDKYKVDLYPNSFQAFTLYHRNVIPHIGYFDERYTNAAEHLDHYFNAYKKGLGSPFWFFPDIHESWKYLADIDGNHDKSVIRNDAAWQENFQRAWQYFKMKHGVTPTEIPQPDKEHVMEILTRIEESYKRNETDL